MQFDGEELRQILKRQTEGVEVYDAAGFARGELAAALAARMALSAYVGVGNRRRIRYLRPLKGASDPNDLHNGSRTTTRVKGTLDQFLGCELMREHRRYSLRDEERHA
jgi:hypothetical protein